MLLLMFWDSCTHALPRDSALFFILLFLNPSTNVVFKLVTSIGKLSTTTKNLVRFPWHPMKIFPFSSNCFSFLAHESVFFINYFCVDFFMCNTH